MPCLTTSLRSSSDVNVEVPTLLFCSSRPNTFAVSGQGDTEEQARKNAEELMTNIAKKFATDSVGRIDLFSHRNDLLEAGGWTKEAVEKRPREGPDDPVDTTSEKSTPCTEVKNDIDNAAEIGDLTLTIPEMPWDSFEEELAR